MIVSALDAAKRATEIAFMNPAVPYVLGGKSLKGTDCSNLIWLITKELNGNNINAGSNTIWNEHVIDRHWIDDGGSKQFGGILEPGILLFIDYNNPPSKNSHGTMGAMDHMGIYIGKTSGAIAPDGMAGDVVHASLSNDRVCFSAIPQSFIRWTHAARFKWWNYGNAETIHNNVPEAYGPPSPIENKSYPISGEAMVIVDEAIMRNTPEIIQGTNHNRKCIVPKGTIMPITDERGGWTRLRYLNHNAWMRDDLLQKG